LRANGSARIARLRVDPLVRSVEVFGFHGATLDLRQSSDVLESVVAELLAAAEVCPDYRALDVDDNFYYELINGELVKKSAPAPRHQMIQANLFRLLGNFIFNNSLGVILCAPVDVFVDDYSVPQPNLLFIAKEQQHIITDDGVMGAPNLVV